MRQIQPARGVLLRQGITYLAWVAPEPGTRRAMHSKLRGNRHWLLLSGLEALRSSLRCVLRICKGHPRKPNLPRAWVMFYPHELSGVGRSLRTIRTVALYAGA